MIMIGDWKFTSKHSLFLLD